MKRFTLAIALLMSAPLLAQPFEEAKSKIDGAQAGVDAANARIEELNNAVDAAHRHTQDIAGKQEHLDVMESKKAAVRSKISAHNQALKSLRSAEAKLQEAISEVGREYDVREEGGKYTCSKPVQQDLAPVESPVPARSYASRNTSYASQEMAPVESSFPARSYASRGTRSYGARRMGMRSY